MVEDEPSTGMKTPATRTDSESTADGARTGRTRRGLLKATGTGIVAFGLAGCTGGGGPGGDSGSGGADSGSSGSDGGSTATSGGATTTSGGEPEKPDSIVVRAWGGSWQDSLDEYVSKPFTEETGIEVEYDNTEDVVMQGKIRTAINQDRTPPINVQWSTTPLSYRSYTAGITDPLDPEIVTNLDQLFSLAKPDVDAEWPFASLYTYTYPLSYRTDAVDSAPDSWSVLWDDEWESSVGVYTRGDGLTPVIAEMTDASIPDDMAPVWAKWKELKPNVAVVGDDTNLTQALREGQIAFSCMVAANTLNLQRDDAKVDWTVPKEGAVAKNDAMWTPKNQDAGERYWSQKYIDFAASERQAGWADGLGVAPLNSEATVPDYMEGDAAFPTSDADFENLISLSPQVYVENGSAWEQEFKKIFG
jgi:putative spermidine/putrescine transport system substrate-binding protein